METDRSSGRVRGSGGFGGGGSGRGGGGGGGMDVVHDLTGPDSGGGGGGGGGGGSRFANEVAQLTAMGFQGDLLQILEATNGNMQQAIDILST